MSSKLKDLCTKIGSGATPRGGKHVYLDEGEISLIRSQNIYNDSFTRDGLVFIRSSDAKKLEQASAQEDDILLNITGDSVARVCQCPRDVLPARVNQHVAIIRPNSEALDKRFLRFFLTSPQMQSYMLSLAGSGGTRNALTKGMIAEFEVPAIPIDRQRRIGDVLGILEDKIALNKHTNETLEAMARAIFKDWFVDFGTVRAKMAGRERYLSKELWDLFPDRLDDEGRPKGWVYTRLADIIEIHDRKRIPLSAKERAQRRDAYPYYGATGVLDYVDDYLFDGIYVLVGEDGSVVRDDGSPYVQYVWGKFWVSNHAHILTGKGISEDFLYTLISHTNVSPYITGAVQQKLSQRNLNVIPAIWPGPQLEQAFSEIVDPLYRRIRANSEESRSLRDLRDLLLPRLVSGEITIREAEDQAAEAV